MSSDKRFEKVFSDPRFMVAPKKVSKVKIDSRFKTMFKDKEFNVVQKVDKYGKAISKKDNYALQNYYTKEDGEESGSGSGSGDEDGDKPEKKTKKAKAPVAQDSESGSNAGEKYYDSDGRFHWSGASSGSDSDKEDADKAKKKKKHAKIEKVEDGEEAESDFNEDVDSATYSDDVSGVWSLDEDEPKADGVVAEDVQGKRIAVKQLDWDSISAVDLFSLFNSFCNKASMRIEKVQIYPSKFGKESMERDVLYGPPKEMFQSKKMSRK